MFSNPSKYYTKYNKNIKAIKGSGVITQRPPKDTSETTGTVKETLHDDIVYMPPLNLRTWDNDDQNTNGYLNSNDYVNYVPDIDKYYYTTQQMGDVIVKKRSDSNADGISLSFGDVKHHKQSKIAEHSEMALPFDPIKLPPPLISTKPNYIDSSKKTKSKNINLDSINNIDGNTQSQYGIGENDINRNWYDGRYLYTFSPNSLKTIYPWTTYNLLYPFDSPANTLKYYQNSEISNITGNPLLRENDPRDKEFFENINKNNNDNTDDKANKSESQNYNLLYLTILCVLIVIYFIKSNK